MPGRLELAGLDHALGEQQVPGLEHLEFGQQQSASRIEIAMASRVGRRIDEDVAAHVHAAHVKAADIGGSAKDVFDTPRRRFQVGRRARA